MNRLIKYFLASSFFHAQLNYYSHHVAYINSCLNLCQREAAWLKYYAKKVIAVGVGSSVDRIELNAIASSPQSSNVMLLPSYRSMTYSYVENWLRNAVCATGQYQNNNSVSS